MEGQIGRVVGSETRTGRRPRLLHLGRGRGALARRRAYRRHLLRGRGRDRRRRRTAPLLRPAHLPRRLLRPPHGRRARRGRRRPAGRRSSSSPSTSSPPSTSATMSTPTGLPSAVRSISRPRGAIEYALDTRRLHRHRRSPPCSTPTATPRATSTARAARRRTGDDRLPALADLARRGLPARPRGGARQLDRPIRPGDENEPRPLPDQRRLPDDCGQRANRSPR